MSEYLSLSQALYLTKRDTPRVLDTISNKDVALQAFLSGQEVTQLTIFNAKIVTLHLIKWPVIGHPTEIRIRE